MLVLRVGQAPNRIVPNVPRPKPGVTVRRRGLASAGCGMSAATAAVRLAASICRRLSLTGLADGLGQGC